MSLLVQSGLREACRGGDRAMLLGEKESYGDREEGDGGPAGLG